jgi:hypothetical protein
MLDGWDENGEWFFNLSSSSGVLCVKVVDRGLKLNDSFIFSTAESKYIPGFMRLNCIGTFLHGAPKFEKSIRHQGNIQWNR